MVPLYFPWRMAHESRQNKKKTTADSENPPGAVGAGCMTQTTHPPDSRDCSCARTTLRDEPEKKALLNRCNRVEGQIRGIRGMLEKDAYCDDILNQIGAVQSALDSISRLILERHMKSCLIERIQSGDLEVVDELLGTLQKMMK